MDPAFFLHIGTILKWAGIALLPLFLLPLITLVLPNLVEGISKRVSGLIDAISGVALGGAIASALLLVLFQLSVVVLRYTYGISFTWLNELVIYAFAAMFMLGSAATLRDDGHVRVDILRPRFGADGRNWIELAGIYFFLFPICIRILTTGEQGLARAWSLFLQEYPLVLTPFLPQPFFGPDRDAEGEAGVREVLGSALWSYSMNFMGLPAANVPARLAELTEGPQPINVQIVARRWREDLAVDAAIAIEDRIGRMCDPLWERMG